MKATSEGEWILDTNTAPDCHRNEGESPQGAKEMMCIRQLMGSVLAPLRLACGCGPVVQTLPWSLPLGHGCVDADLAELWEDFMETLGELWLLEAAPQTV